MRLRKTMKTITTFLFLALILVVVTSHPTETLTPMSGFSNYRFRSSLCKKLCEQGLHHGGIFCNCDQYPMLGLITT